MADAQDTENTELLYSRQTWIPPDSIDKSKKIEDLLKIYDDVIDFVKQDDYDDDLRKGLEVAFSANVYDDIPIGDQKTKPNYLRVLELRRSDLEKMECGITITGDTSSGKTSLVNKLVGKRLVTPKVLQATSKICRIRNSETYAVEVLDKDGEISKERTEFIDHVKMTKKLDRYTGARRRNADMHYIDIYCPFKNLDVKGNVMLVDTPGICGSREVNSMLMDFLPNAFGFIFLIDVSKAGGVEEDRLIAVLQNIVKARYMMPCFEPNDVLFVINKWNTLHFSTESEVVSDDSDDEPTPINEEDDIWNTIQHSIKNVWPTLTTDQLFRLNLLYESTDGDTEEERNQFRRFAKALSQLLEKTKNKKVEMHTSLLFDVACKIDLGIQSRIHTATSEDKNIMGALNDKYTSMMKLQQECTEIVTELQEDIRRSVECLSNKLHAYINSPSGKNAILNPGDKKPIKDCFLVTTEVTKRFQEGVIRWMQGKDVIDEIKRIDEKISAKCEAVRFELERVQEIIMGTEDEKEKTKVSTVVTAIITAPLWLPVVIVVGALVVVATIALSPFIVTGMILSKGMKEKEIDALYATYALLMTKAEIQNKLRSVLTDYFDHRITNVFIKELPREIATTMCVIQFLRLQKDIIGKNVAATRCLRERLHEIKSDLEKLT